MLSTRSRRPARLQRGPEHKSRLGILFLLVSILFIKAFKLEFDFTVFLQGMSGHTADNTRYEED